VRISINQSELQNAIAAVYKGISTRSTLPILSGILLQAYQDTLTVQTSDLELSIKYQVGTLVEEEGETVVPGRLFSEIIKNLPDAAVSLALVDQNIAITCDAASYSIKTLDPKDFPSFPTVETNQEISLPFNTFSSMVKKVARMVSKDESKATFTGILISMDGNFLRMVATDSYRLAMTEVVFDQTQQEVFEAVISGKFLQDIITLPYSNDEVSLALSENQIIVKTHNTVFVNRRIEGNFPNYAQLLPDSFETKVILNVEAFFNAVKRVSLLDTKMTPIRIDVDADSQTVQLSSIAQDVGKAQEVISCEVTGENSVIAFNHNFILDGLNSMDGESLSLEIKNSQKPGIFRSIGGSSFFYFIMPVRIQ